MCIMVWPSMSGNVGRLEARMAHATPTAVIVRSMPASTWITVISEIELLEMLRSCISWFETQNCWIWLVISLCQQHSRSQTQEQ